MRRTACQTFLRYDATRIAEDARDVFAFAGVFGRYFDRQERGDISVFIDNLLSLVDGVFDDARHVFGRTGLWARIVRTCVRDKVHVDRHMRQRILIRFTGFFTRLRVVFVPIGGGTTRAHVIFSRFWWIIAIIQMGGLRIRAFGHTVGFASKFFFGVGPRIVRCYGGIRDRVSEWGEPLPARKAG